MTTRGSQEIFRVNARSQEELLKVNRKLSEGWRIIFAVGYDTDTMLVLVIEKPIDYGDIR